MADEKEAATPRSAFPHFLKIPTRWIDNDVYGHINNVRYYEYFDTVINRYLIDEGGLDIHEGGVVGYCVESMCRYFRPAAYPDTIEAGLRVGHLGRSSVRYELGLYREGDAGPAATGHFVHVFVERATDRSVAIPDKIRAALERLKRG
jgi:acyl-CoA thioester hydrolase